MIIRVTMLIVFLAAVTLFAGYFITRHNSQANDVVTFSEHKSSNNTSKSQHHMLETYSKNDNRRLNTLGWIPYWDQGSAMESFYKNIDLIDQAAFFWYFLETDGGIGSFRGEAIDQDLIREIQTNGAKAYATIANLAPGSNGEIWDYERVDFVLRIDELRSRHISAIVNLIEDKNFDGVIIDYENLKSPQREFFSRFIEELSENLNERGKKLGVVLTPKTMREKGSGAQDWSALSNYADYLYIMTYEEHWETSPPGPIASIPWVKSILEYARYQIPADKLFVGVPFYGYDWGSGAIAQGLSYQNVLNIIQQYEPDIHWDNKAKSKYFSYVRDGNQRTVWFEDRDSFQAKIGLFNEFGVQNIFFWRLGTEDPAIWDILRSP